MLVARREQVEAADEVVDVAEAARLRPVAVDGQRLVRERLAHEGRDRPPVVRPHARAVRVEDPDDRRVDALLVVVRHRQRLGVALRLVVDASRADRVDVPPVRLLLRMLLRIAVDLARGGEQEARALELRQPERVVGAVRADLERVQRHPHVVDRACERGEVEDEVDRLGHLEVLHHVVVDEDKLVVTNVLDVAERARQQVVHADHAKLPREQVVTEVRAEEAGAACHQGGGHREDDTYRPCRPPAVLRTS